MKLQKFIRPDSLKEAHKTLAELGSRGMPIAGGTALHFLTGKNSVTAVDITRLGLSYIKRNGDFFDIGATTPLSDIQRYHHPRWALLEICRRISTHQIRNVSTIGGNIARVFPWADMPVALLAMNAKIVIYSGKKEELTADEYFFSQPARLFTGGKILTEVKIPVLKAYHGFGSVKVSRNAAAFSMATVAALLTLKGGKISSARVAAGSAIPFPKRLPSVESALIGKAPDICTFKSAARMAHKDARWVRNEAMSSEYIGELAEVSLVDALERAADFASRRTE